MILVSHLTKIYRDDGEGTRALKDVSFTIKEGEFVAIMGPSGSGKSTLLHLLSFLDRPSSGTYTFFGRRSSDLSDVELAGVRNKEMGFIFQSFNLLSRLSVFENVQMPLIYSDIPFSKRSQLVRKAVDSVGILEKLHTEAGKLSGGQKQRVAIARALVNDPKVIFADEPTGNLDSASGAQVMEILAHLHKEERTIILVTHETYTAEFAERLIRLKDGEVEVDRLISRNRSKKEEFFK